VCGYNNKWCNTGLICSYFDGVRPICAASNVAPGGACTHNDQCSSVSSFGCINGANTNGPLGVAGVCSGSSAGMPCLAANSTGWCGSYGPNTCGCQGASFTAAGAWQCSTVAAATVNPCADLNTAAITAYTSGGFASANVGGNYAAIALGTSGAASASVKAVCCQACSAGSAITLGQGAINSWASIVARSVDCTAGTIGAAFTSTALTNLCMGTSATTGQNVALSGASLLGVCKAVTGAASSVVPSLALLVAIVAATLALFL
jgi:hypothetical protein